MEAYLYIIHSRIKFFFSEFTERRKYYCNNKFNTIYFIRSCCENLSISYEFYEKMNNLSYVLQSLAIGFENLFPFSMTIGLKNRKSFGNLREIFTQFFCHLLTNLSLCALSFGTCQRANAK